VKPADDKRGDSRDRGRRAASLRRMYRSPASRQYTTVFGHEGEEPRYSANNDRLYEATEPLASWTTPIRVDVVTGTLCRPSAACGLAWVRSKVAVACAIWLQTVKSFSDWMHQWLTGRGVLLCSKIKRGAPPPLVDSTEP